MGEDGQGRVAEEGGWPLTPGQRVATESAHAPPPAPTASLFAGLFACAAGLVGVPLAALFYSDDPAAMVVVGAGAMLAAALWSVALHRPRRDGRFGAGRGAAVAMLAYASSFVVVMPLHAWWFGVAGRDADAGMLSALLMTGLASLVWTPFPWLAIGVGAAVGSIAPAQVAVAASRFRLKAGGLGHSVSERLERMRRAAVQRATAMHVLPLESIAGIGAFVAVLAATLLALTRGPAYAGDGDAETLAFPAAVAFAAALAAWLAAREVAVRLSPGWRLLGALSAVLLAIVAGSALLARLDA